MSKTTAVLVGRFQMHTLQEAHAEVLEMLLLEHDKVMLFLGSNPAPSDLNPMEWDVRAAMFEDYFSKDILVLEMPDMPDDRIWSQELDRRIMVHKPLGAVTVMGSPTGVINRYSGRYPTQTILLDQEEAYELPDTSDLLIDHFRAGIIYAHQQRFPTVYPTVDIALFNSDHSALLLARKPNEVGFRFPGGFVDTDDESYEDAAIRELDEECGPLTIQHLTYLGSAKVDDWRYRGSYDVVMTHLYTCTLMEGNPEPFDDIEEVRWFKVGALQADILVKEHQALLEMVMRYHTNRATPG